MPEDEQRPGPQSEQTSKLPAAQQFDEVTAWDFSGADSDIKRGLNFPSYGSGGGTAPAESAGLVYSSAEQTQAVRLPVTPPLTPQRPADQAPPADPAPVAAEPPRPEPAPAEQTQWISAPTRAGLAQGPPAPQGMARPFGAGREPDPEADTIQIPAITAATTALPRQQQRPADGTLVVQVPPQPPFDGDGEPGEDGEPVPGRRRGLRMALIGAGAVLGVCGLLYGVDMVMSQGSVPRGVSVAGVDVGGMDRKAAEQRLREQIEARLTKPVAVRAGDVEATIEPQASGLTLDWPATLDQAGSQPLSPFTRISSFFSSREVGVVTRTDPAKIATALEGLRAKTDRVPVEGGIKIDGAKPSAVEPKAGQKLEVEKAVPAVVADWASGKVIDLPVTAAPVVNTPDGVRKALEEVALPALSGPVTVNGEGKNATLQPNAIAPVLKFEPDGKGGLLPKLDTPKLVEALKPQLASTEKPGKDAELVLEGNKPVVKESEDGRGVDWEKLTKGLTEVVLRKDNRAIKAEYIQQPAKLTTQQVNEMGVKEVISEFSTGGFAQDSGRNVKRAAEQINGAIVKPGETFSMNARTGARNAANGYVEAGIIDHGKPGRGIGGGVSQMATTLYNAGYFAGMVDVAHKEHSYYISRYPAGREATVFQGPNGESQIDVRFKNDTKTGILITTAWTPSTITVRIWGTKTYEVESITGPRTNPTEPGLDQGPADGTCKASGGAPGFSITDTRVIKEIATGKERRETRTVKYNAQNKVICGAPPAG